MHPCTHTQVHIRSHINFTHLLAQHMCGHARNDHPPSNTDTICLHPPPAHQCIYLRTGSTEDTRVHVIVYVLMPHRVKPFDVDFISELQNDSILR
jgi:hypothetical protein